MVKIKERSTGNRKIIILGAIIIIAMIFLTQYYFKFLEKDSTNHLSNLPKKELNYTSMVSLHIPAVDSYGNGVSTLLKVYMLPGEGKTLVDINQLLFWIDTQQSIQTAKKVAQEVTGVDLSKFDLVYSIEEINASIIEGPSAGAAITIATIAAIKGKDLRNDIMITGTINPDGSIGQVGGILAKAQAAKESGASILLVPKGQGTQVTYIPKEVCEKIGQFTFCKITYHKEIVNVGRSVGINLIEVSHIKEAIEYFGLKD